MTNSIFSISHSGYIFYFLFLTAIALFLGWSIYYILQEFKARRMRSFGGLRPGESAPRSRFSIIAGLSVAVPLIVFAYIDSWQYFYAAGQDKDGLYVEYLFPKRKSYISNVGRVIITTDYEFKRGHRITIHDGEGIYTSQAAGQKEMDENAAKLEMVVKEYRKRRE